MTDLEITDDETFQRFLAAAEDAVGELDADQVSMEIIGRILKAETVDDVLGGGSLTHAEDMIDVPFTLTDVRFNQSRYDGTGPQFYAVLTGASGDGEKVQVSCGARNVIAQAWKLRDMNALPIAVQIEQSATPTANGYRVMWLGKAPASF